jgi:hypothetical protein
LADVVLAVRRIRLQAMWFACWTSDGSLLHRMVRESGG